MTSPFASGSMAKSERSARRRTRGSLTCSRENFALTAAKTACRVGRCGACLVLMNGQAVNSCLLMAWQIEDAEIISPEALDALPEGRAAREALVAEVAFQCGYCAPGFAVALTALLRQRPDADEGEIRAALVGNLCRCTGYFSILRGALRARELLRSRLSGGGADPCMGADER